MKKFLSALIVMLVVTFSANVHAGRLYDYYNNHPDYAGVGRMGYYTYVYLPSIHVQEHNPPHYQIGYNCVEVNDDRGTESWSYNNAKRYNWNTKESFHLENGYWVKDNVGDYGSGMRVKDFANVIFRAAYGMNFY